MSLIWLWLAPCQGVSVAESRDRMLRQCARNLSTRKRLIRCLATGEVFSFCSEGNLHLNEIFLYVEKYPGWWPLIRLLQILAEQSQPISLSTPADILVEKSLPCPCGSTFYSNRESKDDPDDIFYFKRLMPDIKPKYPDFIRRCILFVENIWTIKVWLSWRDGSITIALSHRSALLKAIFAQFELLAQQKQFISQVFNLSITNGLT